MCLIFLFRPLVWHNALRRACRFLFSSDVNLAIEAYEKAAKAFDYPLHLGITESGTLFAGTVKSAAGLGAILSKGIGNTLRQTPSC